MILSWMAFDTSSTFILVRTSSLETKLKENFALFLYSDVIAKILGWFFHLATAFREGSPIFSINCREAVPHSYNCREWVCDSFNCREAVRDSYNRRKAVRDSYNYREAARESYNCREADLFKVKYFLKNKWEVALRYHLWATVSIYFFHQKFYQILLMFHKYNKFL